MNEDVRNEPVKLNESDKKLEEEKSKKNKSKLCIIIPVAVALVLFILVGGYALVNYIDFKKPITEVWGQTYYVYLKDKNKNETIDEKIPDNAKIRFIEVKEIEQPVMTISYEFKQNTYTNVYYIKGDKVNSITYQEPVNVTLLYDTSILEYNYYLHNEENDKHHYQLLSELIKSNTGNVEEAAIVPDYSFDNKKLEKVTNDQGNEVIVTEFDKAFVIPELEIKDTNYNESLSDKELKNTVESAISSYKTRKELITEEVKNKVVSKVEQTKADLKIIEDISIKNTLKELQGVWMVNGEDETIQFYKDKNMDCFNWGWLGSEAYIIGNISDMKYKGNSIYEFTVKGFNSDRIEIIELDASNIKNNTFKINNTTFTYYAKDFDTAYEKYFGWSNN